MDRRSELEGWIARTHHNQRTLAIALACAAAASIGLGLWRANLGMIGFAIVALVAICGFWITSSHIADWRGKLAQLDEPARPAGPPDEPGAVLRHGVRRLPREREHDR
jgi:hypothetical protein